MLDIIELPYQPDSEALFLRLSKLPFCVWLDSGKPFSSLGRYDILSALPSAEFRGNHAEFATEIAARLNQITVESTLPFCGGWIGYLSYSFNHANLKLAPSTKDGQERGAWFGWFDWAVVVDHLERQTRLIFQATCSRDARRQVQDALSSDVDIALSYQCSDFQTDESPVQYRESLDKIRAYLLAGDCYQINYTQRFSAKFSGSAPGAYLALRHAVPSPFSAYIAREQGAVMSISPERFIQIQGNRALTQPIKGTAPRGKTAEEDQQWRTQLLSSPKNRAENVMIVDLLRNDFSQNCKAHSVRVPELFELQSFANVHHLVSTVIGELKPDISHPNFILSCFPGGSITGAPKKRAMEIIDALEQHSRSIYCGAIGYFSCNRNTDFNIAIRTLVLEGSKLYGWAGGGIVIDSDPDQEYAESLHKISALLTALTSH